MGWGWSWGRCAQGIGDRPIQRHCSALCPRCREGCLVELGTDGGEVSVIVGAHLRPYRHRKADSVKQGFSSAQESRSALRLPDYSGDSC
jgi:hypothetical protein